MAEQTADRYKTFDQFWLHYLREHANPKTRAWHFVALTVAFAGIVTGILVDGDYGLIALGGILAAFAIAWSAHHFIEHNHPAFTGKPIWSLRCGLRMYVYWLTGRLEPELKRAGVA